MASKTAIEWTELTWNPVRGCTIVSPGCSNCYAMRMAGRLEAMGQQKYKGTTRKSGERLKWTGIINLDYESLAAPKKLNSPKLIFVNSMSDLFHEDVPEGFIKEVFDTMLQTPRHTYQILTKRAGRLESMGAQLPWPDNVWMGVSVENDEFMWRVNKLVNVPARVRFLSLEPLLGPLSRLNLEGIDWVIAGGESGPGARFVDIEWLREIRDQCVAKRIPFYFKQWGGRSKAKMGRILDGRLWDEYPNRASPQFQLNV